VGCNHAAKAAAGGVRVLAEFGNGTYGTAPRQLVADTAEQRAAAAVVNRGRRGGVRTEGASRPTSTPCMEGAAHESGRRQHQ